MRVEVLHGLARANGMAGECVAGSSIKCARHNKWTMEDMICPRFMSPDVFECKIFLMDRFHRCQIGLWIPLLFLYDD
jgi:hypothetical protein